MRFLIDARSFALTASGGVSRVARAVTSAIVARANNDEIVLGTTGIQKPILTPSCHSREGGNPAYADMSGLDPCLRRDDRIEHHHCHIQLPNKFWSAGCFADLTSFDRNIEKRTGKIDAVFLPNIGWVGRMTRPYVLLVHDLSFLIEPRWFSIKDRIWHRAVRATTLIKNASHLLAVSETTKRDAVRLLEIPPERITVIPIGPSLDVGAGFKPAPTEKRTILAFAGDARKNSEGSIAAVKILRRDPQFKNVELILVGARHAVPLPWISHCQNPSDTELANLYANASCLLYPSWYEGFGLPLHEAAMFGTPCVASSAGALPETAPAGTIFADPAKPHHIAEALRIALTSPRPIPIMPDPTAWDRAAGIILDTLRSVILNAVKNLNPSEILRQTQDDI